MKTTKRQREALTKKATIPYTILAMTNDGEDVNGYWRIKTEIRYIPELKGHENGS